MRQYNRGSLPHIPGAFCGQSHTCLRLNLNLDEQAVARIRPHIIEIFENFFEDFNDYFSTIFKKD